MPKGPTPRLNALISQVNAYCEGRHGSKVALAEYLQVTKQELHPILKGTREPGAEKVLAMLEWLEKNVPAKERPAASSAALP